MRQIALFLSALILWASPAFADHALVVTKSGYYLLEQDAAGVPTLHKIDHVIELDKPGPTPEPEPPTPVLTPRATAIRDAALKATADPKRDETAAKLGELYKQIAAKIRDPASGLKGQEAITFVAKTGADIVVGANVAAWAPTRIVISANITSLAQEGATDADYAKYLDEVTTGLNASITNRQAIDWKQLIKDVMSILEIIFRLFPKGIP